MRRREGSRGRGKGKREGKLEISLTTGMLQCVCVCVCVCALHPLKLQSPISTQSCQQIDLLDYFHSLTPSTHYVMHAHTCTSSHHLLPTLTPVHTPPQPPPLHTHPYAPRPHSCPCSNMLEVQQWIIALNQAAAMYSNAPLASAVGSQNKFVRPMYPMKPASSDSVRGGEERGRGRRNWMWGCVASSLICVPSCRGGCNSVALGDTLGYM